VKKKPSIVKIGKKGFTGHYEVNQRQH